MTYKLTHKNSVIRESDGAFIPANPENRDYRKYCEWKNKGNIPLPADPASVRPRQKDLLDFYNELTPDRQALMKETLRKL